MSMTVLPSDYYLVNFTQLLHCVETSYHDLLSADEQAFLRTFAGLDQDSQRLLVRLIGRRGPFIRRSRINYPEISSVDQAAERLQTAGLIATDPELDVAQVAGLLTRPELFSCFKSALTGMGAARKAALTAQLQQVFPQRARWSDWTQVAYGPLYRVDLDRLFKTFRLLYFGNCYQDLTEFVLQDLGMVRFESYPVDPTHRLFTCRADLLSFLELTRLDETLAQAHSEAELESIRQNIPPPSMHPKVERLRARFCLRLAHAYERRRDWHTALALHTLHDLPPARERRVRMLEKLNDHQQAWAELRQLLESPLNEQERQAALRMAPRIARNAAQTFSRCPPVRLPEVRLKQADLFPSREDVVCIERAVAMHLHSREEPCLYVENTLFNGLLGIWLWPEMFRSVAGAFTNPFQIAPLDLFDPLFAARRPGLENLWRQLESDHHRETMTATWHARFGIANALVNWDYLDETLLNLALTCIPPTQLKAIFTRQLFDLRNNRSGFPDLIQFRPARREYRLIEVKAPGDKLQDNQRRWLEYFARHEIPASVCHVC